MPLTRSLAAAFGHAIGVILVGLRRTGHADGWTAGCCGGCGRPVGAIPASIVRAQIERPPKGFNTTESECTGLETRIALAPRPALEPDLPRMRGVS
jgi:hypothetical protein